MVRRFHDLPSLIALAAFEAAARHCSIKLAAAELNVTPGAISRQVKALETDLGCALFYRVHRGVALTREGEALAATLGRSLADMAAAYRTLRGHGRPLEVTVGATTAFAALWLMPRLGSFWRAHQDITINHVISDNRDDPRLAQADLRLRYGRGDWSGQAAHRLFGDRIYPICGPVFAATHPLERPADLVRLPLLQLSGVDPDWTDWSAWLKAAGVTARPARLSRFTNYVIALQAAQDDQGVALGWHSLVAPLIAEGRLVRLGDADMAAPGAFYVTWNENRPPNAAAKKLRDWLVDTVDAQVD